MSWKRGMMVKKRLSMKKTGNGYNISVYVDDGEVANDLRIGIERFFAKIAQLENPDRSQQILKEVDENVEAIKKCTKVS